jgi:hypothetical protein
MVTSKREARTRHDLILDAWEALAGESVGAKELQEIQQIMRERLGEGAVESPASIARTLADEGAVLRHPEVIEYDTDWREKKLGESPAIDALNFRSLQAASASIKELDNIRQGLAQTGDASGLRRLRDVVKTIREDLALNANSKVVDETARWEAKEVSQWLSIWLNSAELFADWLELRRRSPEFQQRFGSV